MNDKIKSVFCAVMLCTFVSCSTGNDELTNNKEIEEQLSVTDVEQDVKISISCNTSVSKQLKRAIDSFNEENNGYCIEVKDYSPYLVLPPSSYQGDDLEEMIDKANAEFRDKIVSDNLNGCGTDIICSSVNTQAFETLRDSGCMVDFYELDNAADIGSYNDNIIALSEMDGKLYELPYNYCLNTLIGAKEYLGDRSSWTIDDVISFYDGLPENTLLTYANERHDIARAFISDYCAYVDKVNGKYELRADELKKTLEFCIRFCTPSREYPANGTKERYVLKMLDGITSFGSYCAEIRNFKDINGDCTLIGFPSEKGYTASVQLMESFGININSPEEVRIGAWEFLKYALSDECQEKLDVGFSVNKNAFDISANRLIENGSLTQQEYSELLDCVNNAKPYNKLEESALSVIFVYDQIDVLNEEITVDQAVENIRNKLK